MSSKPRTLTITFLSPPEGDWEAAYLGDELVAQGHEVTIDDVLDALGVDWQGMEVACPAGRYPKSLREALQTLED